MSRNSAHSPAPAWAMPLAAALLALSSTAEAAPCSQRLRLDADYYVAHLPHSSSCVATGDWDEDGRADVAAGIPSVPSVITLLGEGDFQVGSRTEIPLDITPRWVVAHDMDGDGHQDLVVTGDGGTRILAGDGTGRFHEAESLAEPGDHVSAGDLDGDGRPDIVLAPYSPTPPAIQLTIILRGTGERLALPGAYYMAVLADFDHDGDLDVAASGGLVWLNDGHAHFSGPTHYSSGCAPDWLDAGDVNGDGVVDLFGVGGGWDCRDSYLVGNGDGTFHAAAYRPSQRAGVIGPEGEPGPGADPHETPQTPGHVPQGPGFVVLVDLNGDGKVEPVRIGADDGRDVNDRHSILFAHMACAADMNGDGKPDIVVAGYNGIAIHPGNGDGTFRSNLTASLNFAPTDIELADLDGDGRKDVAVATDGDYLTVALTAPDGGFSRVLRDEVFPLAARLAFADFNGDGRADALDDDGIHLGNGDGTFRTPPMPTPAFGVPGDFNEDGRMDLATPLGNTVQLYLGNGDGTFQTGPGIVVEASGLQAGDVDHDGHLDLVATATGAVSVIYGRGDGTADEIVKIPTASYYTVASLGDLDGDGLLDLVAPSSTGPAVYLSRGRTFVRSPYAGAPLGPEIGDLNGDGIADLLAGGASSKVVVNGSEAGVWLGHGDGTFEPLDVGFGPRGLVRLDDRDGDGLGDIVVAGSYDEDHYDNTFTVIMNRTARNRPPNTANARASLARSWPPSGGFVDVTLTGITDPDGDPLTVTCLGVTQDEPAAGGRERAARHGLAPTDSACADAVIVAHGRARVRLARDGSGNGRVYELTYSAADDCGASSLARVRVCVPHDAGGTCVDDGQRFNSLACVQVFAMEGAEPSPRRLDVERLSAGRWAIRWSLAAPAEIRLDVFDLLGRRVAALESGQRQTGEHESLWSAPREGVFFVRLTGDGEPLVRRCIVLD